MLVVPGFLGLPDRNREHLYEWAKVGTYRLDRVTERTPRNLQMTQRMLEFTHELAENREATPGTVSGAVLQGS